MNPSFPPEKDIQEVLRYIDKFWDQIILKPKPQLLRQRLVDVVTLKPRNKDYHLITVPYACIVPNTGKYKYVFYWDSYFMFQGIKHTRYDWVIPSMVQNFLYLFKKYHIIPNLSHPEALGRSQPPFLTSMIFDAYDVMKTKKRTSEKLRNLLKSPDNWLKQAIKVAHQEYMDVWQSDIVPDHHHYNHRVAEYNLNTYGSRDIAYPQTAEQESGWDMTSRFSNRCNEFLPVDLNTYLYKYEIDFAQAAHMLGSATESKNWLTCAEERKQRMNKLMWNEKKGFFYDYDYIHQTQSEYNSLAGFTPLWAGLASTKQAKKCVEKLPLFETPYGLATCDPTSLPEEIDFSHFSPALQITLKTILKPKQWDYPNCWPPLEYITVVGLLRYGYKEDAKRIMKKYIATHTKAFFLYNALLEKVDGLTGKMPRTYWYPTQLGFGWTNAIYARFYQLLQEI